VGYYIQQLDCDFQIPAQKIQAAFGALQAAPNDSERFPDLVSLLRGNGWEIAQSDAGDVVHIEFVGEKYRDYVENALVALAPFVDPGSWIEMQGEDHERWRWRFDGGSLRFSPLRCSSGSRRARSCATENGE